jgi:hypothetical protein
MADGITSTTPSLARLLEPNPNDDRRYRTERLKFLHRWRTYARPDDNDRHTRLESRDEMRPSIPANSY